jgi:HlyD family secretion protein
MLVPLLGLVVAGVAHRAAEDAVEVETEAVRARDLVSVVTASGEIQPQRSVDVNAYVNGTIERVAVREGQAVNEGQLLLQIDPVPAQTASEAQAALVRSVERETQVLRAELEQARRDLDRARELAGRDLIAREELQRAETAVARTEAQLSGARARVDQARAMLRGSRHDLSKVTVTAPMSGVITRLNVEEGEFAFTTGLNPTLLLTIADLSAMKAEVEVDETDVVRVKPGHPARVTVDAFPDTTFRGRVMEVGTSPIVREEPKAETDDARDFKVVIALEDRLPDARAGLSATADIDTGRRDNAVAVPIQAVVVREVRQPRLREAPPDTLEPGEEREGVFVIADGKARFAPIEIGITGDRFFEVEHGLKPGQVVVSGSYEALRDLQDGDPVRIAKREPERERMRRQTERERRL